MADECWKDIPAFEGLYQVSTLGRVRNVKRDGLLVPYKHPKGYRQVSLSREGQGRSYLLHRLVAAAFLGPVPLGLQVNHRDGDKTNNTLVNLEYVTPSQNQRHANAIGLVKNRARGERNGKAKANTQEVREMRRLRGEGLSYSAIARRFSFSPAHVKQICDRVTWRHIPEQPHVPQAAFRDRPARGVAAAK
jgi:hypothetical protein